MFSELDITLLKSKNDFDSLLEFMDERLGKDDFANRLDKFEDFEDYKTESGQPVVDYISKLDQKY